MTTLLFPYRVSVDVEDMLGNFLAGIDKLRSDSPGDFVAESHVSV